ncbi:MAG: hypothetical protein GXP13_02500 [Gammaproteobacteria bacterium]|nr:hypothetical protein [Gammaproteobacteria bacterium]
MNTVCIYIDETLDLQSLATLKNDLLQVPHVINVEMNNVTPHDIAVDFEPHHNIPITLLSALEKKGLHSDIFSG